jgi:NAD(P)-dependent dehydrogenase (short-subunit alcohol dehydrogenase family)
MFIFTTLIVPLMKSQGGGKIVNLASIAGRGFSDVSSSAYAAAKGGVIAFTKKTARELGPFGITVNAIAPNTTLSERIRPRWEQQSSQDQAKQIEKIPLRRMAEPIDQAKVICFLASTDSDYVTGQTIDVSGGLV